MSAVSVSWPVKTPAAISSSIFPLGLGAIISVPQVNNKTAGQHCWKSYFVSLLLINLLLLVL